MNIPWLVAQTLIIIWPPYVANATPVLARRIFRRAHPVDGGRLFIDGKRILGDGKTYEGLAVGVAIGTLGGYATILLIRLLAGSTFNYPTLTDALAMSTAALLGDMLGAFIKRRLGLKRGDPAPLLDQLDFLLASLLALHFTDPSLLTAAIAVTAIVVTPPIHLATNTGAYLLKLKNEPW